MDAIQERRKRLRASRQALGSGGKPLAAEAVAKVARALASEAGAEINISQQSISDFEKSDERKRIPAWLVYVERALEKIAAERKISISGANEELGELAALFLAVISKPGSETRQPRGLAKTLAGVAEDYFARGQARKTKKRGAAPKGQAARQAAAQSRGPNG